MSIIAATFYLAHFAKGSGAMREVVAFYGYWGIAVISFISGFNLTIPVPAATFMPLFLELGLNFWFSIFIIVAGVTAADFIGYFLGKFGRHLAVYSANGKIVSRLEHIRERYRWGPIVALFFFASLTPLPNEILLIPLGFLGYRFSRLLPVVISGNFLFNVIYSASVVEIFRLL